jgi:hypothetical protein
VEREIYSIMISLKLEHRILGEHTLQPFRDAQLSALKERLDSLEARTNNNEEMLNTRRKGIKGGQP